MLRNLDVLDWMAKQKDGNCKATTGPGTKATGSSAPNAIFLKLIFALQNDAQLKIPIF
jgi:hypothetical protein